MYCPKCSQEQTEEMPFCSRCGFPLAPVAMLVENNGIIPPLNIEPSQNLVPARSKMMSESAYLTLAAWAVTLIATLAINRGGPVETIARVAAIIFFLLGLIGLARFTYAFLFVKDTAGTPAQIAFQHSSAEQATLAESRRAALPSQQSVPVGDYRRRINTREIVSQPSVTENTTRLLIEEPFEHDD
jgi:hypothetical protein